MPGGGLGGDFGWPRPAADSDKVGIDLREMATGQVAARFPVPEGDARALAFSPDVTRLAAGVANGEVRLHGGRPEAKPLAGASEKHVAALGGEAATGYAATWALIGAGDRAVPWLRKLVRPAAPAPPGAARLIANLASHDYATRERASAELGKFVPLLEAEHTAP